MVMEARIRRRDRSEVFVTSMSRQNHHVRNTGDAAALRAAASVDEGDINLANDPVSFSTFGPAANGRNYFVCSIPSQALSSMLTGRAGSFSRQTCRRTPAPRNTSSASSATNAPPISQNGYTFERTVPDSNDRFLVGRFTEFPTALPDNVSVRVGVHLILTSGSDYQEIDITRAHPEIRLNYADITPGPYRMRLEINSAFYSSPFDINIPEPAFIPADFRRLDNGVPAGFAVFEFESNRDIYGQVSTYANELPQAIHIHTGTNRIVVPMDRGEGATRVPSGDLLELKLSVEGREFRPN